jgi:enoyl-CoA hydratase/carnithine racemase
LEATVSRTQINSVDGLEFCTEGTVAVVTIDNTVEQNRLTPSAIVKLGQIAEMLQGRDDLHTVVIRGAGLEYFSAGILNPVLRGRMSKEEVISLVLQTAAVFDAIEALPQIVIAGLNGIVRAGGVELALACDIRIAADQARLSLPEAKWGGFPGAGGPVRLARLVGRARALELICTGREIDSAQMEKIGFVQKVARPTEFDQSLRELVEEIASSGPLAIRGAKEIMKVSESPGFKAAREISDALRRKLEWSADVDEGIRAHQEGRKPKFIGR